jgi:hypothetical protein
MLAGSYSSNYFGIARSTRDADFVIQLSDQSIARLLPLLGEGFNLDAQMSFETVTGTYRYIITHTRSTFKAELFLLRNDAHDVSRFSRRAPAQFLDRTTYLPSAEDVVITKLRWSKGGARTKDADDVRGVLSVQQGKLDLDYIRHWCDQHATRQLFEELLRTALPPVPPAP